MKGKRKSEKGRGKEDFCTAVQKSIEIFHCSLLLSRNMITNVLDKMRETLYNIIRAVTDKKEL